MTLHCNKLEQLGYAGVPSTRINELTCGYQQLPAKRMHVSSSTDFKDEAVFGANWRPSKGRICYGRPKRRESVVVPNTLSLFHVRRRLASEAEEQQSFSRKFVCTNPKTGRTEMMTARKSGAAHLDLDVNHFDVYASHLGHRMLKPFRNSRIENLAEGLIPNTSDEPLRGKGMITCPPPKLETLGGFITAAQEARSLQALGYVRRKLDVDWSRSNKSSFHPGEGYEPEHWLNPPAKPLISCTIVTPPVVARATNNDNN